MSKEKNGELLKLLISRLTLGEGFRNDYKKELETATKEYELNSINKIDFPDLHNRLQIPYIFSTTESSLPAMFETFPEIYMYQGGKRDEEFTEFANNVWNHLEKLLGIKERIDDAGLMFSLAGMACVSWGWETETEEVVEEGSQPVIDEMGNPVMDELGQPMVQSFNVPREVIVKSQPYIEYKDMLKTSFSPDSQFCVFDEDNRKIPYVIFEESLDVDTVEYIYKKKVEAKDKMDVSFMGVSDSDFLTSQEGAKVLREDIDKIKVYHYYGLLPKKYIGDDWKPYQPYYLCFTKDEILKEIEPITNKKFALIGNYGIVSKFWKFGDAKALRELEKDVSFGRSSMMDYRDKLATKVAVPATAEFDEDAFKSPKRFSLVRFLGDKFPQYITPPPPPDVIPSLMEMTRQDIQMTSGQLDISRGGTTNTVDTATGQKIFQGVHEKRVNRKREKIGKLLTTIAENLLVMCGENWDEQKFAEITDYDPQEIAEKGFVEKLKQIGSKYDVYIEIESVTSNKEAKAAQAIAMFRELNGNPLVNQEELIQSVIKIGFGQKDVERYLSGQMNPEQLMRAVDQLGEMGVFPPEMVVQILQVLQQQMQGGNEGGRPITQNPVDVAEKSMPGADSNQIQAQNAAAYKQMGVPR